MNNNHQELIKKLGLSKIKMNEPLAQYTTFKIGGLADLFCEIKSEEELIKVLEAVRKSETPFFILGNGSNILVGDRGFRGIVIKIQNSKFKIQNYNSKFKIYVDAGVNMGNLINECFDNSLTGLEFMAGIPGTVGGAIRGNAGAWQQNIGDSVVRVKTLPNNGSINWIDKKDCSFNYRDSRFKHNDEIIIEAEFELKYGNKAEIEGLIKSYFDKRINQPLDPSAGCIFVNPKPFSAGKLIEDCGLKGKQIGGAMISEKHANFFINTGGAKASDVAELIDLAKKMVKEKFNIELEEEIIRVGEF